MNIETQEVSGSYEIYLKFGWEHTEDVHHRSARHSHTRHILVRDKDMENYRIIEALENKYFCLYHSKKYYKPVDAGWAFAAFAFFIIPRIIYLTVKHKQKARIKAHNQIIDRQIADVLKEVETLI